MNSRQERPSKYSKRVPYSARGPNAIKDYLSISKLKDDFKALPDDEISDHAIASGRFGLWMCLTASPFLMFLTTFFSPPVGRYYLIMYITFYVPGCIFALLIAYTGRLRALLLANFILLISVAMIWMHAIDFTPAPGTDKNYFIFFPINSMLFVQSIFIFALAPRATIAMGLIHFLLTTAYPIWREPDAWQTQKAAFYIYSFVYVSMTVFNLAIYKVFRQVNQNLVEQKRFADEALQAKNLLQATIDASAVGILAFNDKGKRVLKKNLPDMFNHRIETAEREDFEKGLNVNFALRPESLGDQGCEIKIEDEFFLLHKRVSEQLTIFTFFNITERHNWEQKLRENQKLGLIGQLTSGIAHDYNNILAIALSSLEAFPEREHKELWEHHITPAINALDHGKSVSHKLLSLTQKASNKCSDFGIQEHLFQEKLFFEAAIDSHINIRLHKSSEVWVHSDKEELRSAILNIVINAKNAIGSARGRIDIYTAEVNGFCEIKVCDNGPGIPLEHQEHMFEPFYTTRKSQYSSGLGLAMVKSFLSSTGGHIEFTSEVGATCFKLYVPLAKDHHLLQEEGKNAVSLAPNRQRISRKVLLVDDNELLLKSISQALAYHNIPHLSAQNANQAMALMVMHGSEISTAFLDLSMPDMDGVSLGEKLMKINDQPRYFILTGNATADVIKGAKTKGFLDVLIKPVKIADLIAIIETENAYFPGNS